MAAKRLKIVERKMDADENYADGYCAKIGDYVAKGFAGKLPVKEAADTDKS